jgi:hypothetical protein
MGGYDAGWAEYKTALSQHEESESAKEAAFMERQRSKFSDWRKRAKEYRDKIPGLHQHQSERVLSYIKEREGILREIQTRKNTLGCYILYRLRAQFEEEDRALESRFPAGSSRTSRKAPVCEEAAPLPPPPSIPFKRGKAMSDEPEIAVLERGSISGSDDIPLSVLQSAKGKGKSKAGAAPAHSSKKKSPVQSDDSESERAGSERIESAGEGSEDEGGDASRIVTRKVKVKRGKRLVNVEMTGLRNTYDSAERHQANDLFVFDAPLTSTGGNKIVTHAYPYDEKHPRFSKTWKRQVTLASLPTRLFFTRGKVSFYSLFLQLLFLLTGASFFQGCVRCSLAESDCVRLRYGDDAPTGACMHCHADNVTCEASPVEFDWEVTGESSRPCFVPQSFADDRPRRRRAPRHQH